MLAEMCPMQWATLHNVSKPIFQGDVVFHLFALLEAWEAVL